MKRLEILLRELCEGHRPWHGAQHEDGGGEPEWQLRA